MRKKFEYKTVSLKPESAMWSLKYDYSEIDKTLNLLGNEGWELVSVESNAAGGTSIGLIYTFKREI